MMTKCVRKLLSEILIWHAQYWLDMAHKPTEFTHCNIGQYGLVQDFSISIAITLEILMSFTKPYYLIVVEEREIGNVQDKD